MKKVRIGDRLVGDGESCIMIAEAGVSHNGDIDKIFVKNKNNYVKYEGDVIKTVMSLEENF